jgi:kinetochor protein Mis14/NSL1
MTDAAIDRLRTSEFRKVELQCSADLQHLEATAKRAAREKIDRALPPSAAANGSSGEGDVLRRRVEQLVDEYIKNIFQGVRANVVVNGVDVQLDEKAAQEEGMLGYRRIAGDCIFTIAFQSLNH